MPRPGPKIAGRAEGKAEMAQETICKYLEVDLAKHRWNLQQQVRSISSLDELNKIMNSIYTAGTADEARAIIKGTRS